MNHPNKSVLWLAALLACVVVTGCNGIFSTDGSINRGGGFSEGLAADRQRGGSPADWNFGSGRPGTGGFGYGPGEQPERSRYYR